MTLAGVIRIDMAASDGHPFDVCIRSSRPTDLTRRFLGLPVEDAIAYLPRIFAICGNAHVFAARRASQCPELDDRAARLVVLCENAREHLLRLFTGWRTDPAGASAVLPDVMALVKKMQTAVAEPSENTLSIARVADDLRDILKRSVFGLECRDWLELETTDALAAWAAAQDTCAARQSHKVHLRNWQSAAAVQVRSLPPDPYLQLAERLFSSDATSFVSYPDWDGLPCETGPLARFQDHPLIADIARTHGLGVLARLTARLLDLARIPDEIMRLRDLSPQAGSVAFPVGIGAVETARGLLVHAMQTEGGVISDFRILAPTEWNFHPEGVVLESLKSIRARDDDELVELASLLVEAIDPCVAYEVRVQ